MKNKTKLSIMLLLATCLAVILFMTSCSKSGHRNEGRARYKVQPFIKTINFEKNPFVPITILYLDSSFRVGEVAQVSEVEYLVIEKIK